jgi:four helix bundle protein
VKQNILLEKTFNFAVRAVRLTQTIQKKNQEFVLTRQFLRATSIGANAEEAIAAHSTADFIAKLTIAQKEARETQYWLRLITASTLMDCTSDIKDIEEILKIITSILVTTKKKKEISDLNSK